MKSVYRDIVLEFCKKFPEKSNTSIAKEIASIMNKLEDTDKIRSLIRGYRGVMGKHNRQTFKVEESIAQQYQERTRIENIINNNITKGGIVLAYSCLHAPAHHPKAFSFLCNLKKKYKPNIVVDLGDTFDVAQPSRHGGNPDIYSPAEELKISKEVIKPFIDLFPKVLICESNHTNRYYRAAKEANIPSATMKSINDIYDLPRTWKFAPEWIIDGVVYRHGFGSAPAFVNATRAGVSYVQGHLHSILECKYASSPFSCFFGATAGCLVDPNAETMKYGFYSKSRPVLGALIIYNGKHVTLERMELGTT